MPKVVVGVGSNSDHKKNIKRALDNLQKKFGPLLVSPIYKSAPRRCQADGNAISADEAHYYFNLVISFESAISAENIKRGLQVIEQQQMRKRNTGVVSIDLDLLLYGNWVGQLNGNNIPHEDIERCEFVLRPLADLLPTTKHPVDGHSYQDLWGSFKPCLVLTPITID
jgi:2-amino-4-hydroxy-6-hydroxymethyldihydropteridine diphosphokinase